MKLKDKNWDITLSWILTGTWIVVPACGFAGIGLGSAVGTVTLAVLYFSLAVTGVTGQYWYRRFRLLRDTARLLAGQCDRAENGD